MASHVYFLSPKSALREIENEERLQELNEEK